MHGAHSLGPVRSEPPETKGDLMDGSRPTARPGAIIAVLACAGIVASLMQTLIVPIVGELPTLLHTSESNASWVVTATLLAAAVATPATGRLGDLYGKRRMMLACTVPLIAGSLLCALSSTLIPMITGRALQGIGAGLVPLAISALRDLMPPEKLGSSIALISSSLGIGGALGLPISAAIANHANWHVLFWVSAVLSVMVAAGIAFIIPEMPSGAKGSFDYLGALGLGLGLVLVLLGISKGGDWGWGGSSTVGSIAGGVIVLLGWGLWELRSASPVVDLRVTAKGQVLLTNAASIVVGFAMYAQMLIVPQLLEYPKATGYGLGQSLLATGLWMAPCGLMMMLVSPIGAKLSAARGPKTTLALGSLIIAIGYGSSTVLMGSAPGLMIVSSICSIGTGFAYGAMPALIMGAVPASETASANSFNTLMRSIGTSTASAVVGVILAHMTTGFEGYTIASKAGFRTALLIGCGVGIVAMLVTLTIPVRKSAAIAAAATAVEPADQKADQSALQSLHSVADSK